MADPTFSYDKKLNDETINQVVSDLIMAKEGGLAINNTVRVLYISVALPLQLMHCTKGLNESTKGSIFSDIFFP